MATKTIMLNDAASLATLLCLASPAFPTGGFAYSHGLESATEAGNVHDAASLSAWLAAVLTNGSGRSDAILLRHAHRAHTNTEALAAIAELARAACAGRERQLETMAQGAAFAASAQAWGTPCTEAPYPVAFGMVAARHSIGEDAACLAYLSAWLGNLVSAGVRVVPLGQSDGLRVLAGLQPHVLATAEATRTATLDDIGSSCLRADIASLRHETQYSRLFRS